VETPRFADAGLALRHVFLRDLTLDAAIGVYASEKGRRQRIRVNVDLAVEDDGARPMSRAPIGRDALSRVVDYGAIAERIAESCLEDPRVATARVRVEKLDILPDAASVGVEVERRRR